MLNRKPFEPGEPLRRPPSPLRLVLYLVAVVFIIWWLLGRPA